MIEWFDGNHMTSGRWIIVVLIMLFVWGVLLVAAVAVWRRSATQKGPDPDPRSEDQRL